MNKHRSAMSIGESDAAAIKIVNHEWWEVFTWPSLQRFQRFNLAACQKQHHRRDGEAAEPAIDRKVAPNLGSIAQCHAAIVGSRVSGVKQASHFPGARFQLSMNREGGLIDAHIGGKEWAQSVIAVSRRHKSWVANALSNRQRIIACILPGRTHDQLADKQ
jgi:hypothetical protein